MMEHVNKKMLGMRIRQARIMKDLTQLILAEKINVSPNFLGDVERGLKKPSLDTLVHISNLLNVSIDSLLCDSLKITLEDDTSNMYLTDEQLRVLKGVVNIVKNNFRD